MSFQWIIDSAETIGIERKRVIAQTTSRTGVVRTVNRGPQPWVFDVKMPDGMRWIDVRGKISEIEYSDRSSNAYISLNNSGYSWLSKYQGNSVNYSGFHATWTQGSDTITLTSSPTTTSGYKFRAGDFIQLGSGGKVYTVANDVAYGYSAVLLHRPVLDNSASNQSILVGPDCQWLVKCTQFPSWTISPGGLVSWNGNFVFHEVIA
jgi:hypothetical protein